MINHFSLASSCILYNMAERVAVVRRISFPYYSLKKYFLFRLTLFNQ